MGLGRTYTDTVALTAVNLKALRATPITMVAAPGAGKVLEFVSAVLLLDATATAFAEDGGGSNLAFRYTDGSGAKVSSDVEMTNFITLTADAATTAVAIKDAIVAATGCDNAAIVLHNIGAGELVTGTGVMRVKITYRIHATGF